MFAKLLSALPIRRALLEAKLSGVSGFTGRGVVAYSAWRNGAKKLVVDLRGVAGRSAEILANDALTATVSLDKGRAEDCLSTRKGVSLPDLCEGARIDVRQNGDVILSGVLSRQ